MPELNISELFPDGFDEQKAAALIVALRSDKTKLTDKLATANTKIDTLTPLAQDADKAGTDLTTAQAELKTAQRELYVERALRKFPAVEDLADLLTGDDEKTILATAERLAGKVGKAAKSEEEEENTNPDLDANGRPKPALTPGHSSTQQVSFDPDETAKQIRTSTRQF